MHKVAWQRVFVGTRHTTALCYLRVCSNLSFFPVSVGGAGRAVGGVAQHGNILAFLVAVCVLPTICLHAAAYLLSPFAPFRLLRAGGGWARLGYASWSPFVFVGVVAVLVSCSLRSVAWHVTYLDPTTHVCTLCMFSFCLCAFFVCCASPRWCVVSFTRSSLLCWFFVPPSCPFIPFCSSVAVMTLRRSGHARAGIPFFPYVCGGEHRHSFGVTSCWFSLPVRFSLRFPWRRTLALLGT